MTMTERPEGEENDDFDFAHELTEERDDQASPVIIGAAVAGLAVGLFLWGSIALSAFSAVGLFDNSSPAVSDDVSNASDGAGGGGDANSEPAAGVTEAVLDCDAFGPTRALSPEQEAAFQDQCGTPTPEPADGGESAPGDETANREDCDDIRGSVYRSAEERQWFLSNCVN
jgi:hypothetical protein